jgi:putative ABC transport system permease protein
MRQASLLLRLFFWFSLRHLRHHPWQAATVVLGIALGASVFTSVRFAVHAAVDSFGRSMDLITGTSDAVVLHPGGRIPDRLVASLLDHPAVLNASPLLSSYVQPAGSMEETPFLLLGLDPVLDRPFRTWKPRSNDNKGPASWLDLMAMPESLLIGEGLAKAFGAQPGHPWQLTHSNQTTTFRVLAALHGQGIGLVEGGRVALTDLATMQEFTGLHGWVDRIELQFKPSATKQDIKDIDSLLPAGVILQGPDETRRSGKGMIDAYQQNLSVLSFVSLFVGMYLVYSLVALNAAARRKELATLRALGASPRLLFGLFLCEGVCLGLIGWVLAIPGSVFLTGKILTKVTGTINTLFVHLPESSLRFAPSELLISFGATLTVSLLAAFQPAREAMKVPPQEVLQTLAIAPNRARAVKVLALLGLLLVALVYPLASLSGAAKTPLGGYAATFVLFAGFSLMSPWALHFLGSVLPPMIRRLAGPTTGLAARYLKDAGARTAISVGALITAMALFVALAIMVHSFRKTVETWVTQAVSGDVFVRPAMAGVNDYRDPLPEDVVVNLKALIQRLNLDNVPYRRIYLRYGTAAYQFEALDVEAQMRHGGFLFMTGKDHKAIAEVQAGRAVLVSEVFLNRTGLKIGDRYRASVSGIMLNLPIAGIVRDYRTHGGVVYASLHHYQQQSGDLAWNGARLFLPANTGDRDAAAELVRREILAGAVGGHNIEATLGQELHAEILRIFDETFAITTVMLLIALLVAALGITTTLTVLVLERTQQLQTLVAIGGSFAQIRSMIFWEAVFLVAAGETAGLICGFALAELLNSVINRQSFGWTFVPHLDWSALLMSVPSVLITALLAALPAIRLALRSSPALVLRER